MMVEKDAVRLRYWVHLMCTSRCQNTCCLAFSSEIEVLKTKSQGLFSLNSVRAEGLSGPQTARAAVVASRWIYSSCSDLHLESAL